MTAQECPTLRARPECAPYHPGFALCLLVAAIALLAAPVGAATNDLTSAIQRGLFEEEANQNLGAAIQAYQTVASQFDKDRKLAATAIFRLGECYRKQGNTNDAATQYERILREFSDQPTLVTLSRQNLVALGGAPTAPATPVLSDAARQEQRRLLEEEKKLVERQLESQQKQVEVGVIPPDGLLPTQRDLLKIKRQLAALDAGAPVSITASEVPAPAASTEADEVRRIQALIKDSPDLINAPDRKGETLLQAAAAKGKVAVVKLLLDSGAAVDGLQQPGLTALHYAAANGHKAIVDLLLSKGAKADAQTAAGVTPLHLAALRGYETVAKALLAAGAPVNAIAGGGSSDAEDLQFLIHSGLTPLHLAAEGGYASLVELLLAKGADANAGGRTPLSYAVEKHYLPVARLLLAAHADPNAGRYNLPLAEAALFGDLPALKLLLANGANPNTNTSVNWNVWTRNGRSVYSHDTAFTPLFLAVNTHQADAVAELLRAKADPNVPDPDGQSLLFDALPDARTLQALLEAGAEPNRPDSTGASPLLRAVFGTNQPAVELLLAHKADPNAAQTQDGWTPLCSAAANGEKSIAELLLKAGADVNEKDKDGETPLYLAVRYDQRELAALLLANQADPNAKNNDGWTPLHFAVNNGNQELAKLLLANKADPNERDTQGRTPLDLAKSPVSSRPGMPVAMPFSPGPTYSGAPGGPYAAARPQEAKPQAMADLLRAGGAVDNLPQLDRVTVRRSAIGATGATFTKGSHDWNQFTLLELLAVQYGFLADSPLQGGSGSSYTAGAFTSNFGSRFAFPDLTHLHISRPAADLKSWQDQVVDLTPVVKHGECAKDVRLRWGDVVEIPEADHPLSEKWDGFTTADLVNLKKCLTRQVEIVVKGQVTPLSLAPQISVPADRRLELEIHARTPFWLKPVLLQSKLVLISSDLSRVKVIRRDAATGQQREWVVDCSEAGPAPDFWLKDGDRIEVPEKTFGSTANAEVPQAAAPGMAPPSAPAQPGLRTVVRPPTRTLRVPAAQAPQAAAPLQDQWPADQPAEVAAAETPQAAAPKPAALSSGPADQAAASVRKRRAKNVQPPDEAQTPEAADEQYLDIGGVRYSPKPDDPELLNAGYHKDRSAMTRKAEFWEQRAASELSGRAANAVWTGTDMVVFGGEGMGTSFDDGARYCLAEDTWAMLPQEGAPSSRTGHAMVWTGKEVIVWGGFGGLWGNNTNHKDGARYNPATDTWKPVSTRNAPSARFDFPAVWTGKEMLVWGGYTDNHSRYQGAHADAYLNTGGCYNPSSDTWKPISTSGAPSRRAFNTLVWTGKEMIIWGGGNATKVLKDGGRYNPAKDSWKPISPEGAPSPRGSHVAVWTGKEMIVWGGSAREASDPSDYYMNGARYDPETDTWKPISTIGAPKGRVCVSAVWTGTEMVLWGGVNDGQDNGNRFVGTGGRYNPATDTWTEIITRGAPSPRLASVVWTGDGLLTFGGYNDRHLNDTWFYAPQRTLYPYAKQ